MSLQPFPGFQHFTTMHCVTGSMRHLYAFHGIPVSEELLLGLGEGVGFIYWHSKNTLPFLGGRANAGRPGEEGLERMAGRRTGLRIDRQTTSSAARAEKSLVEQLSAGQPVMLVLDMGFLPYFDFGPEFHFGYHVVVACGYEPETRQVLLADRDAELHPVSLAALARARGSTYPPFPPRHGWYQFDIIKPHPPQPEEVRSAIQACARGMLHPPITNLGIAGIEKAARRIPQWPQVLGEKELRNTCINTCVMIDARGGTGGGLFRYMYGRFLHEATEILDLPDLCQAGEAMHQVGDRWQEAADLFEQAYTSDHPGAWLVRVGQLLPQIARQERAAWQRCLAILEKE